MPTRFSDNESFEPARTRDGVCVSVMANVGDRDDVTAAARNGADGIGLCRIERCFVERELPPSPEKLERDLRLTLAPFVGMPVTVRLLHAGSETQLQYVDLPAEKNPVIGVRGARLLASLPDLIKVQLRALLALSDEHELRILVPFVTLPEQVEWTRDLLEKYAADRPSRTIPPVGAMIETPAAALNVDQLSRWADFLAIETSRLAQFAMAASCDDPRVRDYSVDDDPSILWLIRNAITKGSRYAGPVVVCGDLAEREDTVRKLLALGVRSLCVRSSRAARVKNFVRTFLTRSDGL